MSEQRRDTLQYLTILICKMTIAVQIATIIILTIKSFK